jgi:hypothetical protein
MRCLSDYLLTAYSPLTNLSAFMTSSSSSTYKLERYDSIALIPMRERETILVCLVRRQVEQRRGQNFVTFYGLTEIEVSLFTALLGWPCSNLLPET